MPSWSDVLQDIQKEAAVGPIDKVRRGYLARLHKLTGRNVIAYYSGWLSHPAPSPALFINDEDKNAFMATVHKLDRSKGLDLILHTPGGDVAAVESLVDYLRKMFGKDMRAIVPQLAMSGGTMIACACTSIVMGKQSNLGPMDPQMGGIPAAGVLAEFKQALDEIKKDPMSLPLWQQIIGKYHPTFLGSCKKALDWSKSIATDWLVSGMFAGDPDAKDKADKIVAGLTDSGLTLNHARHIHVSDLEALGLKIEHLEAKGSDKLQDLVLTVHHSYMHTFASSSALKIVENHKGAALVRLQTLRAK